ncbi:hypothetical protein CONPUDRAFT_157710 [Coniophora puteana RWD-64-598 SS2]|uniref:CHAT domain-containing protein n=1 Tax=Coniophora puteana (strain RWD-64-598) TaxID=741705 RepID=A0A5M3ME21_CONPW|nr:uncharacterized protein CONPUDRAFT_157710 [Coniophora puteana RWD-64-598 SS2]EIW77462.1 hypothetical protein CONPUDRAFT_157710 [Coniophora puteana RWD-64-598 SS2]
MKRLFRRLKSDKDLNASSGPSKNAKNGKKKAGTDEPDEFDRDRAWWETDEDVAYFRAQAQRTQTLQEARAFLDAQLKGAVSPPFFDDIVLDPGAAAGKTPEELLLQQHALSASMQAFALGRFGEAKQYLLALSGSEHLPATWFRLSYICLYQGYRTEAAEYAEKAKQALMDDEKADKVQDRVKKKHERFKDLLKVWWACTVDEDYSVAKLEGPESLSELMEWAYEKWLVGLEGKDYDSTSCFLLIMYCDVTGSNPYYPGRGHVVEAIMENRLRSQHYADIFQLIIYSEKSRGWGDGARLQRELEKYPSSGRLSADHTALLAAVKVHRAEQLEKDGMAGKEREKLYMAALKDYKKSGHAWGHLTIKLRQLLYEKSAPLTFRSKVAEADKLQAKFIQGMVDVTEGFAVADFPKRQMDYYEKLFEMLAPTSEQTSYDMACELRGLYRRTGRWGRYWATHLMVMAFEVMQVPELGSFLEDAQNVPQVFLDADPALPVMRTRILFFVAYRTGDADRVVEHGHAFLEAMLMQHGEAVASEVAEILGAALMVFDPQALDVEKRMERFEEGRQLLWTWAQKDFRGARDALCVRKNFVLARGLLEFKNLMPDPEAAVEEAKKALAEARQLGGGGGRPPPKFSFLSLGGQPEAAEQRERKATFAIRYALVESLLFDEWEVEAIKVADAALREHGQYAAQDVIAQLKLHTARRRLRYTDTLQDAQTKHDTLVVAVKELAEALDVFAQTAQISDILECKYWQAAALVKADQPEAANEVLVTCVKLLDILMDDAPVASGGGVSSLRYKRSLATSTGVRRIFALGLQIALAAGDEQRDLAWQWAQHAKARALADMLRLNGSQMDRVPAVYFDGLAWAYRHDAYVEMSVDALAPLLRMSTLAKRLKAPPGSGGARLEERADIKREMHELKGIMRQDPTGSLAGSLAVLTGAPASLDDLRWVSLCTSERVLFFDWVAVGDVLYLIRVEIADAVVFPPTRPGERPAEVDPRIRVRKLGITVGEVEHWRYSGVEGSRYLDRREMSGPDAYENLNMLRALVEPLKELSEPGDILVLCPTAPMHGIPLHAIGIEEDEDGEMTVLLERNPVVYTYSHSVLRQCVARAKSNVSSRRGAAFFGVYEHLPGRENDAEPARIVQTLEALAGQTQFEENCVFMLNDAVTPDVFRDEVSKAASLVHFHGHTLDAGVALEQALVLAGQARFSAEDAFDLELAQAPHVTLIACASTDQATAPGDEPLGILSALLFAGAGSAVGTLWKTASADGRAFSKEFYEAFEEDECLIGRVFDVDAGVRVINLARAVQRAALASKAKNETEAPYHWATFVLYGCWFGRG